MPRERKSKEEEIWLDEKSHKNSTELREWQENDFNPQEKKRIN